MFKINKNKALIPLISLESSIYDERPLSRGTFVWRGFCQEGLLSEEPLSTPEMGK